MAAYVITATIQIKLDADDDIVADYDKAVELAGDPSAWEDWDVIEATAKAVV